MRYADWEFAHDKDSEREDKKARLPSSFYGYPVVDGDGYDMRFLDNEYFKKSAGPGPYVVGLRVKGIDQHKTQYGNSFFFDSRAAQDGNIKTLRKLLVNSTEAATLAMQQGILRLKKQNMLEQSILRARTHSQPWNPGGAFIPDMSKFEKYVKNQALVEAFEEANTVARESLADVWEREMREPIERWQADGGI